MSRADSILKYFNEQRDETEFRVKTDIERYRKGNATLNITKDGKPAVGAKVKVSQTNHEFKHGANIFMLEEFENQEKNEIYKEAFKEVFNLATVPFYWSDLEPEQGKPRYAVDSPKIYRRPATDLCVNYCLENKIEPKCHCLNYMNFSPKWLSDSDPAYYKFMLEKRFSELAERYSKIIPSWEVTNETLYPYYRIFGEKKSWTQRFYYEEDFVEWSFLTADKYFHNNHLIINDFRLWGYEFLGSRSVYYLQIKDLLRNPNIHLDSIGMQNHVFCNREGEPEAARDRYNPNAVFALLDTYAKLGKKIQITEMTLSAYSKEKEDEELQAEIVRNLYPVYFSHPAMEAIIYWNLVDGYAAFAPQGDMTAGENVFHGGLMNYDMTKKPSFYALKELFTKTWHTEATAEANETGKATFRGFYGNYDVTIMYDGKEYKKELSLSASKFNESNIEL